MTADPSPNDTPLPRVALERVLARAAELQLQGEDAPDVISESRLLEIGREVGIDPGHLKLAIAEERGRVPMLPDETGRIADALGDPHTAAQRAVYGTPDDVLSSLDRWLQREEQFTVKRRFGTRMSWEKARSPFAVLSRSMSGRATDLSRADDVSATVTAVDETRSLVRLDADLRVSRKAHRDGVLVLGALNVLVVGAWTVPLLVVSSTVPTGGPGLLPFLVVGLAMLGVQAGVSTLIWRSIRNSFRSAVTRTQLRLEQLLDALEHGHTGSPPTLLEQLRESLRTNKRPGS